MYSLNVTKSEIVHVWEFAIRFVIFAHFLVFPHLFQLAFVVIFDLKCIGLIRCRIA